MALNALLLAPKNGVVTTATAHSSNSGEYVRAGTCRAAILCLDPSRPAAQVNLLLAAGFHRGAEPHQQPAPVAAVDAPRRRRSSVAHHLNVASPDALAAAAQTARVPADTDAVRVDVLIARLEPMCPRWHARAPDLDEALARWQRPATTV